MIREERYIVIKLKDANEIFNRREWEQLRDMVALLPDRKYVVVEDDWPEYEQVWKMIEDRVDRESV